MSFVNILLPERVQVDVAATSKKRALEQLSKLLAAGDDTLSSAKIFDALLVRERLGSTGIGFGIAIPHARHADANKPRAACMRLQQGVDFDAPDREPVDFIFGLLVPHGAADEHVQTLASIAEMLDQAAIRERLRVAPDGAALMDIMTGG
jgi:nitrogen PTS system EIIA component